MKILFFLGLLFFPQAVQAQALDCSFQGEDFIQLRNGALTMRHVMNPIDETLTVELVYEGQGWISLGFSQRGRMTGSYAVIGLPDQPVSATNPGKYYLGGETVNAVRLMPDAQQTLTDTSLMQNATHTSLSFTKPLAEVGELAISATAQNTFIYATGFSNQLGLHNNDGSISLVLTPCRAVTESSASTTTIVDSSTTSNTGNTPSEIVTESTAIEDPPAVSHTTTVNSPSYTYTEKEDEDEDEDENEDEETDDSDEDSESSSGDSLGSTSSTTSDPNFTSNGNITSGEIDCSLQSEVSLLSNGRLTMRHVMNPIAETLTVELVYEGEGWLGFGFSSNGRMTGASAVIGLPSQPLGPTNPGKYFMGGRTLGAVQLVPDIEQTLTDASITQNATHSTMRFTKRLVEDGELTINAYEKNTFIYATGVVNGLSPHNHEGAFTLALTSCQFASGGADASNVPSSLNSDLSFLSQGGSTRQLWIWHGFLMAVSWGILVPLAIGSSMLRDTLCLAPGVWLTIHLSLNMFAILCMVVSFGIAVYATNANTVDGEDPNHFSDLRHRTIGLVLFLLAFMQAASGLMRPSGPKKPATPVEVPKDNEETFDMVNESSDEFERTLNSSDNSLDIEVSSNTKTTGGKSIARRIWEYKHRIMGLSLLGLSWYNCDSGLELFAKRYGENNDLSGAFWGVTGGLAGLICVLYAVQIARR
jgi:hypothetical protein